MSLDGHLGNGSQWDAVLLDMSINDAAYLSALGDEARLRRVERSLRLSTRR